MDKRCGRDGGSQYPQARMRPARRCPMGAKRPVQMDWGLGAIQASLHAVLWEMRQRPSKTAGSTSDSTHRFVAGDLLLGCEHKVTRLMTRKRDRRITGLLGDLQRLSTQGKTR
jgi:hypothetical protein